jgi:hypothetical protein
MAESKTPDNPNTPTPPFNFGDPRQRLIHERLSRLVGQSAAEFYKDACRFMSGSIEPPFAATTNIVAHMLREVESSLRDVLAPLAAKTAPVTEPDQEEEPGSEANNAKPKSKKSSHVDEIRSVVAMLGVSEDDELAKAWMALPGEEKGLQKYTHRPGLKPIRPLDEDFRELWTKMETILHGVLDRFEARYIIVFDSLESLAQKTDPTRDDASYFASSVPNNFISHTRFFDKLTNPKWLPLLRAKGIFKDPPPTEYGYENGEKTIRYPLWPASAYLLKMAVVNPSAVKDILIEVADTDNANVKSALLEISAALPKAERLLLTSRIKGWVQAEHSMYVVTKANSVITAFLNDGEATVAIEIARVLLTLRAAPRAPIALSEGNEYTPAPNVRSRIDEWQFGQFMKDEFKKIAELDSRKAFTLAEDLLNEYVTLHYPKHLSGDEAYKDYTYISRPAIEDHEQNHMHDDLEDHLIKAVRDTAAGILKKDPKQLGDLVSGFEKKRWSVFMRLAMHVVAETESPDPELVKRLLISKEFFHSSEVKHEYARLIGKHFGLLDPESKKTVYGWIGTGEEIEEKLASRAEPLSKEDAARIKEYWQLERLTLIGKHLDSPWKEKREELVVKQHEPEHPDFASYSYESSGMGSVIAAQDMLKMTPDEIINLLKTWEPAESKSFFEPTREGLARELAAAIRLKPELFEGMEKAFEGLDPTYVRTYIQTFHELSQRGRTLKWEAMLGLCKWVIEQPRAIAGRAGAVMDQDPDWGWTRGSINSLIATGLGRNAITYELRESVWQIIEHLASDPNPTPEEESRKDGIIEDAYSYAINTVRGYAIQNAIEYGLWVRRNVEKEEGGKEVVQAGLKNISELKAVLEKHLNDQSIAVRAVYGRFIPWLLLLDETWMTTQKEKIFPTGKFADPLYRAAWSTYVLYVPVYTNVFPTLRDQYKEAVDDLSVTPYSEKNSKDPQRKLGEHLVVTYWRGEIPLYDPLLVSFWTSADAALRGHVMEFVGTNLQSDKEPLKPEAEARLRALWEQRSAVATAAANKENFEEEMSSFGWWFASGKFEEKWANDQYLSALEFGSKTRTHHFVADRLVEVSNHRSLEALQILSKIIDLEQPDWMMMGNRDEVFGVLRTALQSSDAPAQKMAREIINRLVARGHSEYANLLKEFPDSSATTE